MTRDEIQRVIDDEINPALETHGGYVLIRDFDKEQKSLKLYMGGGCQGCAASMETLKFNIEDLLREQFPNLGEIEDVTDHDAGENPYL